MLESPNKAKTPDSPAITARDLTKAPPSTRTSHSPTSKIDSLLLTRISIYQIIGGIALTAAVASFASKDWAWGVAAGAFLMTLNFGAMKNLATRATQVSEGDFSKGKASVLAFLFAFKFTAILAAIAILVLWIDINPIGLAIGMASLLVGLVGGTLHHFSMVTPKAT